MSKKFSISEGMLNGISKNVKKVEEIEAKGNFKVEYIDIENIKRNEKNFYDIVDVEELAEDIKLNGLNHNLVVRKLDNGQFELISGERRYTALSKLVKEGNKTFALVPCKVIEANDIDAEIILIQANAQTRELSEVEKLKQVQRLKELYKDKKAKGEKVPGKIREIIANDLKLSPTQVGRYEKINSSLIPELKNVLEKGNLTIANASEFANLSEDNQKVILELINSNVNLSKNEAIELKNKLKKIEEEKALEYKEREKLIQENSTLKNKLNSNIEKTNEERKELEGQLRIELEKELESKYADKLNSIKDEVKKQTDEKAKLKDEISKLKANAPKNVTTEFKENITLIQNLKNIENSLSSLYKQIDKMRKDNIKISDDTKNFLSSYSPIDLKDLLNSIN
ncbi:ParB N-terminal domain-containing protein [Clostridium perfringens]|uniref:ParB/RepB/Spo0J family partition protein n=5 Tax=Clostridium perfringens TaxID=1502 RepID=UPI000992A77B|nr:ParB/RepB/Spo0J family partition protein [Clostridium perfringens]AQW26403.1 chromosome partitioning protein ParB [Clostridium perfringens]ATD48989.1 chromosome partitioning protein ParB [Clostridium perfringens]KAB8118567.1 chromosome partitioning protein ParB [Clostridium perfringens]MBO3403919.1 ParB N-terminal domain-containing protein [Clostridium perfringens]MBO3426135.1 ParB N-terminal domain-containing protein [Clostridium perfringens]